MLVQAVGAVLFMYCPQYTIALDAGFRNLGVAIWHRPSKRFVRWYSISFPAVKERYVILETQRVVRQSVRKLTEILSDWPAHEIVAELPVGGGQSSRSVMCMAVAATVVLAVSEFTSTPLRIMQPIEVKRWAAGSKARRSVTKKEVMKTVRATFGKHLLLPSTQDRFEHVADAMAAFAAYAGIQAP